MSRDRRFVAVHRGGSLDRESHVRLARWAADCAERVLPFFERCCKDDRPRRALDVLRVWAAGDVKTGVAMKASLAAHAAARNAAEPAPIAAARAAGQAAGTAHCADHCMGALVYALKAMAADGRNIRREFQRRVGKLPPHLREQVEEGVVARLGRMKIPGTTTKSPKRRGARKPLA